jgi:RNA polymerase nonessential primary-like sigma factor
VEDIAHLIGRDPEAVRRVLAHNEHLASLDAPLDVDPMLSIGESIADDSGATPEAQLASIELETLVGEWLGQLTDKQRTVIESRFGLGGHEVCTLESLADRLGITRERVRQIQLEALAQLRTLLRQRGFSKDVLL